MNHGMNRLLVIGGASSDVLHLEDQTVACAGGAGMYTAMAARRCGAQVALFAPRPDPCPESLQTFAGNLEEWFGPAILPDQMPRFEISYRQGKTKYLNIDSGGFNQRLRSNGRGRYFLRRDVGLPASKRAP